MPPAPLYLGLDLGTTSAKIGAFTAEGTLVEERSSAYPLHHPEPGAAVQHVEEIVAVAERLIAELLDRLCPQPPRGMSISCPMHGVLLAGCGRRERTRTHSSLGLTCARR